MKALMSIDRVNGAAGAVFILIGLYFGAQAVVLPIGTAFRMGPGYFPLVLAAILILLGVIIVIQALRETTEGLGPIAWRGMVFILAAPVLFALLLRGLGFVPSVFITAFVAAFASTRIKPLHAVLLAAALTGFTVLVFIYGLGLPLRPIGPWLGGY